MLSGMNWLLLRGLTREIRHWGAFPLAFAGRLPGVAVHCLDLPGVGTECRRNSPSTVAAVAKDVRYRWLALAERVPPREWAVLGISLGGMVALAWCSRHPGDFQRAVLVNTSAGGTSPPLHRFRPRSLGTFVRILSTRSQTDREELILAMTSAASGDGGSPVPDWVAIGADAPVAIRTLVCQLVAAARFHAPSRLGVSTLFLASRGDLLVRPSCSERLAYRYSAPVFIHPSAGHDLPLDDPDWVGERVATWLASSADRTRTS